MRTIALGTCAALLLCAGAATNLHAGPRVFGDGTLPALLAVYDLDGNGILSEQERQAMNAAREQRRDDLLAQWDLDHDGVISEQERTLAQEALRLRMEVCRAERFNEADTDGDGFLSFAEFSAIPAVTNLAAHNPDAPLAIFNGLDTNDDNKLSLVEFLGHLRNPPRIPMEEKFAAADTNDDQVLTFEEFAAMPEMVRLAQEHPGAPRELFDRLDANDDNQLTLAEFMAQPPCDEHPTLAEQFAQADANDDGFLSFAEFGTLPPIQRLAQDRPEAPQQIFDQLDTNNDDQISPTEFLNLPGLLPPPPPPGGGGGGPGH